MLSSEAQTILGLPSLPGLMEPNSQSRSRHCVNSAPAMQPSRFGQCKKAKTILADQGDFVTIITDESYISRTKNRQFSSGLSGNLRPVKGTRAMHQSTLLIPNESPNSTDYTTTVKANFGGKTDVAPVFKSTPYPSQHKSQISLRSQEVGPWETHYKNLFHSKPTEPHYKLHWPTFENKMSMNEGNRMKDVIATGDNSPGWTQYKRVHDKLGVMLGPGVSRDYPVRKQYNVITGQEGGAAWQEQNKRISGNRILYHGSRKDANSKFMY